MGSTQRGAMIAQNDNGTLERVDGTSTYVGSATLSDGKVITKRFRSQARNDEEVTERWLAWQNRLDLFEEEEKEASMANNTTSTNGKAKKCLFGGCECHPSCALFSEANQVCSLKAGAIGLFNLTGNFMKLDPNESLELIAMALGELKQPAKADGPTVPSKPTKQDGLAAFFDGKTFLSFVNLHGKAIAGMYAKFCKEKGFPAVTEKELLAEVDGRYAELKRKGVKGGSVFEAA